MPPFDQVWRLQWKIKKELFGKRALVNGGQDGDDKPCEELEAKPKRTPESVEPVFYHGYPAIVYQDILKALQVRYCIDLTPGDGAAALACDKLGIFYLGLTFTTTHTEQLSAKLEHELLQCMADENDDRLHSPALVHTLFQPEPRGRKMNMPDDSEDGNESDIDEDGFSSDHDDSSEQTLPLGCCQRCWEFAD